MRAQCALEREAAQVKRGGVANWLTVNPVETVCLAQAIAVFRDLVFGNAELAQVFDEGLLETCLQHGNRVVVCEYKARAS